MSYRGEHDFLLKNTDFTDYKGVNFDKYDTNDLKKLWRETLESGMSGLCFSMYEDGQEPGDHITEEQVERRIKIIKPYTKWVRSFSCIEGNEHVPRIAKKHGLKTMVGAWLGDDLDKNEDEIEALIALAKEGYVDAYYEFSIKPKITEACDVILSNCYPFWEGCDLENSLTHMQQMFGQASHAANGKKVIITETGWPSKGTNLKGAFPSEEAAMKYFINAQLWSKKEGIDLFYFSSFDESWKVGPEGDVGAYWGLWDKNEKLKF